MITARCIEAVESEFTECLERMNGGAEARLLFFWAYCFAKVWCEGGVFGEWWYLFLGLLLF